MEPLPRLLFIEQGNSYQRIVIVNDDLPVIARVIHFVNRVTMLKLLKSNKYFYESVQGYNIVVIYAGVLGNTQGISITIPQIECMLHEIACAFLEEKIKKNIGKYEKYLIKRVA